LKLFDISQALFSDLWLLKNRFAYWPQCSCNYVTTSVLIQKQFIQLCRTIKQKHCSRLTQ